jgi:membrane protein YqaA with SNARE-associated domain
MTLAGAVIGFALGLLGFAAFKRSVYPAMRRAHEAAKVTQSHGIDPGLYRLGAQVLCLVVMPVAGLFLGHQLASN